MDINFDRTLKDIVIVDGDLQLTSDFKDDGSTVSSQTGKGISGGLIDDTGENEGIRQNINSLLLTFAGEYFKDESDQSSIGVPWFEEVLQRKPLEAVRIERVVRNAILSVVGVQSIEELILDFSSPDRILNVEFVARTTTGSEVKDNIVLPR